MQKRIAIVEDDPVIRANYADVLKKQGYDISSFGNRREALASFRSRLPDLVILDIGLDDDVDAGFTLCRELRALSSTLPIIFLTARDSDFDMVSGLRMGADDYVTKNVSLPQLLARVSALFRRIDLANELPQKEDLILRGALSLDLKRFSVSWKEQIIDLTLTEFWLVHALARYPGHVKNRDQLMTESHIVVDDSTITSHVKRIRKKFMMVDSQFDRIDTVYGMGYRWKSDS